MALYGNLTNGIALNTLQYYSLLSLNLAEMFTILIFTCPISALNFLYILRTSILHPNLKFILLSQSASIFARCLVRIVAISIKLHLGNLTWMQTPTLIFIFTYFAYFRNILAHILVIERVRATLEFKTYEWSTRPYFSIIWFILVNALTVANIYETTAKSTTTLMNILLMGILLLLAIIELAIIFWLRIYNDRIYCKKRIANASLSERYQLAENIRTVKQLTPVLFIHFFNIAIGTFLNCCGYFQLFGSLLESTDTKFHYELITQLHMCIVAITIFLIELLIILFHPYLKRNLIVFCGQLHSIMEMLFFPAVNNRVEPTMYITNNNNDQNINKTTTSLTSIRGEEMLMMGNSETDEYFRQLRLLWEKKSTYMVPN